MRTIGAVLLAAIAANIWARVRISIGLCSVSTTSQSNPRRLTYSAASGEGRESQVPIDGSPAASRRRTWFARIVTLLLRRLLMVCTLPVMLGTVDHCSSSSDSILSGSISTPNPGRSETVIMPSTGLTGSCQKNWSSSFHFTRYSTIGASSSGMAMVRCVLAGTEWPWAMTGMS